MDANLTLNRGSTLHRIIVTDPKIIIIWQTNFKERLQNGTAEFDIISGFNYIHWDLNNSPASLATMGIKLLSSFFKISDYILLLMVTMPIFLYTSEFCMAVLQIMVLREFSIAFWNWGHKNVSDFLHILLAVGTWIILVNPGFPLLKVVDSDFIVVQKNCF